MIELIPISKDDAVKIAEWRNESIVIPTLRSWKQTNPDNQSAWLNKIFTDPTVVYYSIYDEIEFKTEHEKVYKYDLVGYCGLDKIESINRRAEISLLINPDLHKKGYGSQAIHKLLDTAFNYLGLKSVYGEVYDTSTALSFWIKCGFKDCGIIQNTKFTNGKWNNSNLIYIDKDMYDKLDR